MFSANSSPEQRLSAGGACPRRRLPALNARNLSKAGLVRCFAPSLPQLVNLCLVGRPPEKPGAGSTFAPPAGMLAKAPYPTGSGLLPLHLKLSAHGVAHLLIGFQRKRGSRSER